MSNYRYYYENSQMEPLTACPNCGNRLDVQGGVKIVLSVAGKVVEVLSQLSGGSLVDTEDHAVANGFHSGTTCAGCGELLLDLEGVEELCEEE